MRVCIGLFQPLYCTGEDCTPVLFACHRSKKQQHRQSFTLCFEHLGGGGGGMEGENM